MQKITDPSQSVKMIQKYIESGRGDLAISRLNSIQKSAYNRLYRLEQQAKKEQSDVESYVVDKQIKQARSDLAQIKHDVKVVKKSIKDPIHTRNKTALTKLSLYENRRESELNKIRSIQSQMSKLAYQQGKKPTMVSMTKIKAEERIHNLMTNLLLNNPKYDLDEQTLNELNSKFSKIGLNLNSDIRQIFTQGKHYSSGDEFDGIMRIIDRYSDIINNTTLEDDERDELNDAINLLYESINN